MKVNKINLNSFQSKGYVLSDIIDEELKMTTTFNTRFARRDENGNKVIGKKQCGNRMEVPSFIYLPDKYKLPLQIDLTVCINAPALHLMFGGGYLSFGVLSGGRNMQDISGEPHSTSAGKYFNHIIPFNEFFNISVLYDWNCMQIKVNGDLRYYSENERYMKSKAFLERNREGLEFMLTCHKHSELIIKKCMITEYQDDVPERQKPAEAITPYHRFFNKENKINFDFCISELSKELQDEVKVTDSFIKSLKPLSPKRKIDKGDGFCRISYISDYGFAYHVHTDRSMAIHYMNWILYNTHREQEKYGGTRKRELTGKTLSKLAEKSPEFAKRMYDNLVECVGCACIGVPKLCKQDGCICCGKMPYGLCPTLIEFNGRKKSTCHGKMEFIATPADFTDARKVIEVVNDILKS